MMQDPTAATELAGSEAASGDDSPTCRSAAPPAFAREEVIAERFKILRFLGQGGMGQVFEAEDLELGDPVAVKVIRPGIARHRQVIECFKREVQLARQVTHANVCRVFDLYQHRGAASRDGSRAAWPVLFLTMELLRGETLAQYLRHAGTLSLEEALPLIRQMVAALEAAHQAGVVHRDFKTGNVMLVEGGRRVVVTDFGLAHTPDPAGETGAAARLFFRGTPAYMSPEQHAGHAASARSDLYALGLVLYELLTGHRPFAGSPAQLARLHREVKPAPPSSLVQDFDPTMERVILQCLEKDPRSRPRSARAVAAVLGPDAALGWRPAPGLAIPHRPHWTVERKLGEGGFGQVWLAAHSKTRERRIFKFCFDATKLRSLEREITLFRLLKEELGERDDIARLLDWDFDRAPYFIEAEYRAGGSLAQWAGEQGGIGAVPLTVRLEIVAQVATALAAAHSVGVLHKDVKPANVLITRDPEAAPQAQLTDFGVGAVLEWQRLAKAGITILGLTETSEEAIPFGGTPLYLAPELLEGKAATIQADIYALGVLLYQVVVGDLSRALASGWQRDVDDELLREDIASAVDGSPERRLGNALRLAEGLRALETRRAQRQAERRWRDDVERSRRRRRLGAVVIGVSMLFAAAMLFQERRTAREAARAEREAARARNHARVAVAGEWLTKDPTKAALVLLEVEKPDETVYAVSRMRQALRQELASLELGGHHDIVWTAAFSPSGDRIVTASGDGTARIWNVEPPHRPAVLRGHDGGLWGAWFSPRGERLVTAARDGTARVWSVAAPGGHAEPIVLAGHSGPVRAAAFSPQGDRVATASIDGTARVWSLGAPAADPVVLEGHSAAVESVFFHPGGDRVVTASKDGTARVWNADGSGDPTVFDSYGGVFWNLALSPRGDRLAATGQEGITRVWNTEGSGQALILEGHGHVVVAAAFDARGERLVTASWDGTARVWSLDGPSPGEPIVLEGHSNGLFHASFSPQGDRILTTARDGTARIWNADGSGQPIVFQAHDGWIVSASFSPQGDRVVTGAQNGRVRVWNVGGSGDSIVFKGHGDGLWSASFSPDGRRVVTASQDGTARVWEVGADGAQAVVLAGHEGGVIEAAFSPRGDRIATSSRDGTVRLWEADGGGTPIVLAGHEAVVSDVVFSPDGSRVVSSSWDGTARLWNVEVGPAGAGGEPIVLTGHGAEVSTVAFSPRGDRVATSSNDGTARLWNVETPNRGSVQPILLEGHENQVWAVSFSPDGSRLVSGSWDCTARVWNVYTPDQRPPGSGAVVLEGHTLPVVYASFDPDGERVVTASLDGTARVWNADGSGGRPCVLRGHDDWVVYASFSPDGTRIVTASHDSTARVWDARCQGAPIVLEGHGKGLWRASFSPDGSRVVTASLDGTARVWTLLDTSEVIAALRAETRVCLDPEFRQKHLGERATEARRRYESCERVYGRRPPLSE